MTRNLFHGKLPLNLLSVGVMIEDNDDVYSSSNLDFFPVKLFIGEMQNFGATAAVPTLVLSLDAICIARCIDR